MRAGFTDCRHNDFLFAKNLLLKGLLVFEECSELLYIELLYRLDIESKKLHVAAVKLVRFLANEMGN